jgi:hypothetical protein
MGILPYSDKEMHHRTKSIENHPLTCNDKKFGLEEVIQIPLLF